MKQIFLSLILFSTYFLSAQEASVGEIKLEQLKPLFVSATGTGRTTGHVASVVLQNNSSTRVSQYIGPFLIPSNGKSQGYLVPDSILVDVDPNSSTTVELNGFCTNIRLKAASEQELLANIDTWAIPDGTFKAESGSWTAPIGFKINFAQERGEFPFKLTYPGTDHTFIYTADFDRNAKTSADYLLQVYDAIETQYNKMEMLNNLRTPYSIDLEKQKAAIVQHTFWIITAALLGDTYSKETFREKMLLQYNEHFGAQNSNTLQGQFDAGVDDFWNAFLTVAKAAKVFKLTNQ